MAVTPAGRAARTDAYVVGRFGVADLLRLELHTGRTHQIRVHLEHIGHPIVGDPVYAGGGSRRISGAAPPGGRRAGARHPEAGIARGCSGIPPPRDRGSARIPLRMAAPICGPHCLHWVPKNLLLAPIPLAIFFSSIEMANSPTLHAVIFRIGALICAAPAGIVREILPRLPATRIPGVAEAIEGLVNVRGTLLTVLDGHVLLQQSRQAGDEGAIVVVEVAAGATGWASGRCWISSRCRRTRSPSGRTCRASTPGWSKRSGMRDGQHFILLDIDALVAPIIGS